MQKYLISPAWVISHLHNLLFKRLHLALWFIAQSLEVHPPVPLLVATANAVRPYPPCKADRNKQWETVFIWLSSKHH